MRRCVLGRSDNEDGGRSSSGGIQGLVCLDDGSVYNVGMNIVTGRFVTPEVVTTHFHLREGDQVADFGAGSGYFIDVLANTVGASGRVYACEIQKELVEKIGDTARAKGYEHVDPLWCDLEASGGIKIQDEALDVGILVNTLFQMEDRATAITEIMRTLKSGAKFFVVDWTESFMGLGPQPDQVCDEATARTLCESAGLVFDRSFDAGDHHYGLAFRKG